MTEPTIDAVENESSAVRKHSNTWRVVDIVVAAIIAVASGVIFWAGILSARLRWPFSAL